VATGERRRATRTADRFRRLRRVSFIGVVVLRSTVLIAYITGDMTLLFVHTRSIGMTYQYDVPDTVSYSGTTKAVLQHLIHIHTRSTSNQLRPATWNRRSGVLVSNFTPIPNTKLSINFPLRRTQVRFRNSCSPRNKIV
jgi:hypothetical protein